MRHASCVACVKTKEYPNEAYLQDRNHKSISKLLRDNFWGLGARQAKGSNARVLEPLS